ncbi:ABC transporter substrate-binding protein [Streptomyces griseocarneus]|nr:ABC transporter substrate-binding protein [Streptomyces griseocarneus]
MIKAARAAAVAAATVSAALVLAACGGGDGSGSSDGGQEAKAAPAAGTQDLNPHPASDLKQGGTYKVSIEQWINQYNPNQTDGTQGDAASIIALLEPDLFDFDAKGVPHPNPDFLVSAKVTSTNPQVVTYELNPKAKWSDGKPLGVADFEAQWKALNGTDDRFQVANTTGYDQIGKVEQGKDEHEVRVTFKTPFADWQSLFDPLLPASLNATPESFNTGWTGRAQVTGNAWKIGEYDKTAKTITAVPDPDWWGEKPKLDKYIFWAMDGTAKVDAYLNREIDYTSASAAEAYKRLKKDKDTDFRVGARWDQVVLSLNGSRGPLQDLKVRQAVTLGVDREALAKIAGKDLPFQPKVVNNHFFMPNQEGYRDNAGSFAKRDVDRAKKLLDEAGWKDGGAGKPRVKDGKPLSLDYVMPSDVAGLAEDQAKITQQMLGEIGVKVELRKVPGDDYFDKYVHRSNYDLTQFRQVDRIYRSSSYQDYRLPQGRNAFGNYGRIGSQDVDKLMTEASRTTDEARQIELYNQADAKVWELGHSLPLYQRPQIIAIRKGLANTGAPGLGDENPLLFGWLK